MTLIKDPIPDETKKMSQPCRDCPFSKTVAPGYTGGSDPAVYIGQGHGPFYLPCHKTCDFNDPNWKEDYTTPQQCAGAAMYRANTNRDHLMPKTLLKLPKSDKVFGSPAELYAHHKQISLAKAREFLKQNTPNMLMAEEFKKAL